MVVALLALDLLLAWAVLLGVRTFVERVWFGLAGYFIREGTLAQHAGQIETARLAQGLVWIAAAAAFLAWMHRAYRNLPALGASRLGYSPRWAVGAFLVPVLNLVHPYHVVRELWRESHVDPADVGTSLSASLIRWWWVLFVASVLADPVVGRLAEAAVGRLEAGGRLELLVIGEMTEIAAGVLAIIIVTRTTRLQEESVARQLGAPHDGRS
ncbi:MAG TPA: DUF4328 domain-containing protein [Methylomirabilota bacterium]|nr:DUF4328 domain-containing protein [Methylomirabilota bacterium]